jgi:hypothetical protein
MTAQALIDAELAAGPLRLGGVSNATKLELELAELDATVFTSTGWRAMVGGLKKGMVESSGFMDSTPFETGALAPDAELWNQLGGAQVPVTVSASAADQSVAYILPGRRGKIDLFGKVGELSHYGSTIIGDGATARGALLHPATVTRNSSGSGTIFQLGTVPAGRSVLIALHIFTVSTGTFQLTVQSDDNAGFTTPTSVANLGPVGAASSVLVTIPGPVTDDRYRVTWTPASGAVGRFLAAVGTT